MKCFDSNGEETHVTLSPQRHPGRFVLASSGTSQPDPHPTSGSGIQPRPRFLGVYPQELRIQPVGIASAQVPSWSPDHH